MFVLLNRSDDDYNKVPSLSFQHHSFAWNQIAVIQEIESTQEKLGSMCKPLLKKSNR